VTAAISKGQLPILVVGLIILIPLYKVDGIAADRILTKTLALMENGHLFSWVGNIALILGWMAHGRFQRKTFTDEITRISEERNRLQSKLDNKVVESSTQ